MLVLVLLGGVWLISFFLVVINIVIVSVFVCWVMGGWLVVLGCVIGCVGFGLVFYLLGLVLVGGLMVCVVLV